MAILFAPLLAWGFLSLWYGSWNASVCVVLASLYGIMFFAVILFVPKGRIAILIFTVFLMPLVIWFLMKPSLNRDWQPDVAVMPFAEINENQVVVHNVRNCDYITETDFTPRFETRTYDLSRLKSIDLILINWGVKWIAHTMISFGFEGDQYLCFSIETRKEVGESYSALKGFFHQYELIYIAGDERDLIRLRTNFRKGEEAFLYRLRVFSADRIRNVFLDYLARINQLHEKAEWYNALTENCMTSAFRIARKNSAPGRAKWHWSIILNGYADRHLYDNGLIDESLPFNDLKEISHINSRARAADNPPDFSRKIRKGLPGIDWGPGEGE